MGENKHSPTSKNLDGETCPHIANFCKERRVPSLQGIREERKDEEKGELSTNTPKITITGFERMLIENYRGILEYQDYFVRVNTYIGILNINGFDLKLEEMTTDDLLVTGKIDSIDFESVSDEDEDEK